MQSLQQYDEFLELKTEFTTVVEALSLLHDFIENVFGDKFDSFCTSSTPGAGDLSETFGGGGGGSVVGGSPRVALRDLKWKLNMSSKSSKSPYSSLSNAATNSTPTTPTRTQSTNSSWRIEGGGGRELDGGGGGGGGSGKMKIGCGGGSVPSTSTSTPTSSISEGSPSRRFSMVGKPEIVEVKLEMDCGEEDVHDFLEDVDPFCTGGGYEESEINITPSFQNHLTSTSGYNSNTTAPTTSAAIVTSTPNRYNIPGLIPIQDPLLQDTTSTSTTTSNHNHYHHHLSPQSSPSSDEEDDDNWRQSPTKPTSTSISTSSTSSVYLTTSTSISPPSSTSTSTSTSSTTSRKQRGGGGGGGPQNLRRSISLNSASMISPQSQGQKVTVIPGQGQMGEGGPFKCSMCPASYRQEDSLRSHQKYKHNPSRVQCECHLCGKSMVDKYRLQRHLRLHTGERPFTCQFCDQRFYRKDYHTKHLQRKHGIPYVGNTSTSSSSSSSSTANHTAATTSNSKSTSNRKNPPQPRPPPSISISKSGGGPGVRNQRTPSNTAAATTSRQRSLHISPGGGCGGGGGGDTRSSPLVVVKQEMESSLSSPTAMVHSADKDHSNFIMDYFSGDPGGAGGGLHSLSHSHGHLNSLGGSPHQHPHPPPSILATSGGSASSALLTMAALTFDDLISADL